MRKVNTRPFGFWPIQWVSMKEMKELYPAKVTVENDINKIKKELMILIGGCIDEKCLLNMPDSFVEMDHGVIHCATAKDQYFKVTLTETTEDEYFKPYEP